MIGRTTWFVAGAAAGVYASIKARRAAYRLSAPGVVDQAAALGAGLREFAAEYRDGSVRARHHLAERLHDDLPALVEKDTP